MVFELDTKDMERHKVELRLALEKAKRRFEKAQMQDLFEDIVVKQLPSWVENNQPNVLQIERVSDEENQRLRNFLRNLIERCQREDQFHLLQETLRFSLQESRRRSIMVDPEARLNPMCLFCANHLDHNQCSGGQPGPHEDPLGTGESVPEQQAAIAYNQVPETPMETPSPDCDVRPPNVAFLNQQPAPVTTQLPSANERPILLQPQEGSTTPANRNCSPEIPNASMESAVQDSQQEPETERMDTSISPINHLACQPQVYFFDAEAQEPEPRCTVNDDLQSGLIIHSPNYKNKALEGEPRINQASTPKVGRSKPGSLASMLDLKDKAPSFKPVYSETLSRHTPMSTPQPHKGVKPSPIAVIVDKLKFNKLRERATRMYASNQSNDAASVHQLSMSSADTSDYRPEVRRSLLIEPPPPLTPPQPDAPAPGAAFVTVDKGDTSQGKTKRSQARPKPKPKPKAVSTARSSRAAARSKARTEPSQSISQPQNTPVASNSDQITGSGKPKRFKHKQTPRRRFDSLSQ